ncbi:cyclophilin-like domain-containing protein [Dioszegia hungarica]|uniref:Peptidyl-prolyl isomerase CWC27 n=1 Tax=Dioszegia hungarica TaxID=4972 RepID=A0AA38LUR3_9TREE|nr:cyclophilin-like domain-containing protein [Dioszegia hungarica]KAI9636105.1 cyclophilin-like domain-containing protein [Dioszegia hungarica]
MSNLYVTEPVPNGKVILDTTSGEVEMELWGKEAPKAVRNFLQLAMEGYYDGVIFHRVVKGFIVQTGDPTGTGTGGESIYGEPFADEIHGRLKFSRRGLIGMANSGKRSTNTSQFFITLDAANELTGKHTVFGRIMGNTIYNVLSIGELDVDADEKPKRPPKIRGIRIVENPFDDIVPRITASEKRAQQAARLEAKRESEVREKRAKAKKNTGLLSFGEAEEIPEEAVTVKKKGMGRQDLVETLDERPKKKQAVESFVDLPPSLQDLGADKDQGKVKKAKVDLKDIRAQHERDRLGDSAAREAEIKRMQDDLRKLKKLSGQNSDSDSDSDDGRRKGTSYLQEELAKYSKNKGLAAKQRQINRKGRKDEEDDLIEAMSMFSQKVKKVVDDEETDRLDAEERGNVDEVENGEDGIFGASRMGAEPVKDVEGEVDDDVGWMKHSLKFMVDEKELTRRAEEEYSVIDPRVKAKELARAEAMAAEKKKTKKQLAYELKHKPF